MAAVVQVEVLESITQKILVSLGSDEIQVLPLRRKFLTWKMRDFSKSFGSIKKENRGLFYEALVKISTELDGLREDNGDPEWLEATRSFVASRAALEVFQDEMKVADAVVSKAFKIPRIGRRRDNYASDLVSDLRTDLNRTSKVMAGSEFDDAISKASYTTIQTTKEFLKEANEAGKIKDVAKLLAEPFGKFAQLKKHVEKLSKRETLQESDKIDIGKTEVYQLDLSIHYEETMKGGHWFNSSEDGTSELRQCFVFFPGATAHVLKIEHTRSVRKRFSWQKPTPDASDIKVTVEGIEYWVKRNTTDLSDAKTFTHMGHKYEVAYSPDEDGVQTWTTVVDGQRGRTLLTHQQWIDAKHRYDLQVMLENAKNRVDLNA
mmetsp:Transcript_1219/g.1936  ORF Transcript_1219/g.1936 Transcript_1219/m.1936 type:complete len:376 (-) Transcript_1219:100-1227(-)